MLLALEDLSKRFGGIDALRDCSLGIGAGEITGLIGPNGSGKSTLFNIVTGLYAPDRGTVRFDGERLTGLRPHEIARRGVGRTFQTTRLFPTLTVLENVQLGAYGTTTAEARSAAARLLDRFGLGALALRSAEALSFGQRRLVELARSLVARPKLVLMDEPFAGLSAAAASALREQIEALPALGIAAVLIEHSVQITAELCRRVVVLDRGAVIADGAPGDVLSRPAVVRAYLGGDDFTRAH